MALRVARGLFRLWLVLSVLWIGAVGIVVWHEKNWMFKPDGLILVPGSTADICSTAKDEQQCFDLLRAAGKNPYTALDELDRDRSEQRRKTIQFVSTVALVPPAFVLALGSALLWAVRGFR